MLLRTLIISTGIFLFTNLFLFGLVRAADEKEKQINEIIASNFSKSVVFFYTNTVRDITDYINNKFAFYTTMVKNLNSPINFAKFYNLLYNQVEVILVDTIDNLKQRK